VFEDIVDRVVPDLVSGRNGQLFGDVAVVAAPPGACGAALRFPDSIGSYILVANDPAWQLTQGSLDFWLRPGPSSGTRAVVTRDRTGAEVPGHFGVFLLPENRLVVRIQESAPSVTGGTVVALCSNAHLDPNEWVHVGINFGPPEAELFIDGIANKYAGPLANDATSLGDFACGLNSSQGIAGNQEPWVFGASFFKAEADNQVAGFAKLATVGRIRISSERQDFKPYKSAGH
jgi:hypothetical protein